MAASPSTDAHRPGLSLQARIAAAALVTAVSVLLAATGFFFAEQWREDAMLVRRNEAALSAVLGAASTSAMDQPKTAQRLLQALAQAPAVRDARLSDAAGRTVATYRRPRAGRGRPVRTVAVIQSEGRPVGELQLEADPDHLAEVLPRYLAVSAALFFAATGAALFLGRWLAARLADPIDDVSEFMQAVTEAGDLAARAPPGSGAEMRRLTDSFNALLDRLAANDQALRRTMEELVAARDAAEAANVLKSQFLANMSHEIRTPLNGVLAMAQVMDMGELSDAQRGRLQVVRRSGEALLTVLNDVLDVSKIEAGEMTLESVAFDPAALTREVAETFAPLAAGKGLSFEVEVGPGLGLRLGDEARLRQVLSNLVSNALKFTPQGGVRLTVADAGTDGDGALAITVADTGIGVEPDALPKLFDKFVQADASTTRRFGGTGLGLAICRELVTLMGGRIWVESRLGEGAVFHVIAPAPRVSGQGAQAEPREPTGDLAPMRVLAAEDNPGNRQVLATLFEAFGMSLEMVGDGRAAVEAWRAGAFDVILMDIQMPEMDGVSAARAIRAAEAEAGRSRTPIIALSANAMAHQVREYLAAGMDLHVAKPIELARLVQALEDVQMRQAA